MMKISFDKKADAFAIVFKEGRVSRDDEIAKNVFAGFDVPWALTPSLVSLLPPDNIISLF